MTFKKLTFGFCALLIGTASFAQSGDEYEKEIKKRIATGEITMSQIEAKINSGEIQRFGQIYVNPKASLINNLTRSKLHVTLAEAIVATPLKKELDGSGTGVYTVFAPRDEAFSKLPEGKLAELTAEGNEEELEKFAGNHIVKGEYSLDKIKQLIDDGKGRGEVTTLSGMRLYFFKRGTKYVAVDEFGTKSTLILSDLKTSNGYIHDVNAILMAK